MKLQLLFAPPSNVVKLSNLGERIYPPLGILYLASALRKRFPDIELKVTDGLPKGWDFAVSEIRSFRPDILFISYVTPSATSAYALGKYVKSELPEIATVFGGPHATALPDEPFARGEADFVVVGEGEVTSTELVAALWEKRKDFRGIDGLYWRSPEGVMRNGPREFVSDLDALPFPAWDLLDMGLYTGWFARKKMPDTSVLFSRGCPFDCTFCSNCVWKSSRPWLRLRSPKNIADELLHLRDNIGIREVFNNADEFNCNLEHAYAVCRELKERSLGITWKAQLRAHPLPEALVKEMAESGCWYIHLGIESGNERTLKGVRKNITLKQVEEACRLLKKYRIKIFGLFMLFNAWEEDGKLVFEGVEETRNTLRYARRLINEGLIDYMSCSIATPYPGSELFEIAKRHALIRRELLDDWNAWLSEESFIMELPGVTKKDAGRLYFEGMLLRSYCCLRSGNWSLKDIPLFFDKVVRAVIIRATGK